MKTLIFVILILFIILNSGKLYCQGQTAMPFLIVDPFAKAGGIAGAYVSATSDASAQFYNPACLVRTNLFSADLNHLEWLPQYNFNDLNLFQTSVAFRIPSYGHFGIYFTRFNLGENIWTDETGAELGTFNSYEWCLSLGYADFLSNQFSIGVNLKLISSNLSDATLGTADRDRNASGIAIDIGILGQNILSKYCYKRRYLNKNFSKWTLHRQPPGVSFGISISNIGNKVTYIDKGQADPLPQYLRLGVSWHYLDTDVIGLLFSIDTQKLLVNKHKDGSSDPFYKALFTSWSGKSLNKLKIAMGQEISILSLFAIRFGYFYEDPQYGGTKYFTYGTSLGPETFRLNLSYIWTWGDEDHPIKDTLVAGISFAY
jgi:hypothetical protein